MVNTLRPRHAGVQFADPTTPSGAEISRDAFLKETKDSALARFRTRQPTWLGCRTFEHPVPPQTGSRDSTGMIIAHLSPAICRAWEASTPGTSAEKKAHVGGQVDLALTDLADQDMHGYLALTEAQCQLFGPDLIQLTTESLDRTTFSHLGRRPDPHWEGTLVERVRPPYLVLTVSVDFEKPAAKPSVGRVRRRRIAADDDDVLA